MFNKQLISVVVPVHNGAQWIRQTLDSLFAQTYRHFEIILVDDASSDNLSEVLASFHEPRLQVVHLNTNVGVSAARNLGIEIAKGTYIAFCDADDLCQPQRFKQQLDFLGQHTEIGLCGSAFICFDTQEHETISNPVSDTEIRKSLLQGNCFGLSTVMGRANVFKTNRFDEALSVAEDYDLWTRLVVAGVPLANLPESLIHYRWHPQQASRSKSKKLDQATRKIRSFYSASLLGDPKLLARMHTGSLDLYDLDAAAESIATYTFQNKGFEHKDFRFMLAWMYQLLPTHGVREWLYWTGIQQKNQLQLDRNYRLNTALLAFLPAKLGRKYFDTLIKLKR